MKIVWKGKYLTENQLSKSELPADAIMFREPKTPMMLNIVASLYIIPVIAIAIVAVVVKNRLYPNYAEGFAFNYWGFLLAFITILPHEALHAVAFPKEAVVEVWYSLKNMMAFVFTSCPTSKRRFIFLSLLPNMIFGFIPLVVWTVVDIQGQWSSILFSFSFVCMVFGIGDYLNVWNAARQMPKGSITQLSGFHSYWYMPK